MCFKIFIVVLLIVGSIYDWKYMSLPKWLLMLGLVGGMLGIGWNLYRDKLYWGNAIEAMFPGVAMLALSRLSKEHVGCGDGLVLLGMGGCMEYMEVMYSFWLALLMVFVVSAVLVIFKGVKYNVRLPFVPFLAIGSIGVLGGGIIFG